MKLGATGSRRRHAGDGGGRIAGVAQGEEDGRDLGRRRRGVGVGLAENNMAAGAGGDRGGGLVERFAQSGGVQVVAGALTPRLSAASSRRRESRRARRE